MVGQQLTQPGGGIGVHGRWDLRMAWFSVSDAIQPPGATTRRHNSRHRCIAGSPDRADDPVAHSPQDVQGDDEMDLTTRVTSRHGCAFVTVDGELDLSTAEQLTLALTGALDEFDRPLVLDLAGLRFCDS